MTNQNKCFSGYLKTAFEPALFKRAIDNVVKCCKHIGLDKFDALVFRGMSGCLIAPTVALKLGKRIVLVRKEGDGSHSSYRVEGYKLLDKVVIIDDLVSSGGTLKATINGLCEARQSEGHTLPLNVVATILYHDTGKWEDGGLGTYVDCSVKSYFVDKPVYSFRYDVEYCEENNGSFYFNKNTALALGLPLSVTTLRVTKTGKKVRKQDYN